MDSVKTYLAAVAPMKVLTKEEELELIKKAKTCNKAKTKILENNLKAVIYMCKPYMNKGVDLEDLIQEGNIGLMAALDKFDPSKGFRFCTYAGWWIKQKIRRAIAVESGNKEIAVEPTSIEELSNERNDNSFNTDTAKEQIDTILERLVSKKLLTDRDVKVFYMNALHGYSLAEIGRKLSLSREAVRLIYNKTVSRLENSKELQKDYLQ
jgi:RNA polymerase primary sigma factor